jgi:hypothetical protein
MNDRKEQFKRARAMFGEALSIVSYETSTTYERLVIDAHLSDIALLPERLVVRVLTAGLRQIIVGPGKVTDLCEFPSMEDQPWLARSPGLFDRSRSIIVLGTVGTSPLTEHNALHEVGHAIGHLLRLNDHEQLIEHHSDLEVWMRLPAYFRGIRPGDQVGRAELLAEAIRERILHGNTISRRYGPAFMRWLNSELELR